VYKKGKRQGEIGKTQPAIVGGQKINKASQGKTGIERHSQQKNRLGYEGSDKKNPWDLNGRIDRYRRKGNNRKESYKKWKTVIKKREKKKRLRHELGTSPNGLPRENGSTREESGYQNYYPSRS